jgi:hypothetical protein
MVINRTALIIGAVIGFLIAILVGVWEGKMAKKKKDGIVTLSVLGGIAFTVIIFFAIGEIAPYDNVSDILRNAIIAALFTFLPFRKIMGWINLFALGNKSQINDEHKDD